MPRQTRRDARYLDTASSSLSRTACTEVTG